MHWWLLLGLFAGNLELDRLRGGDRDRDRHVSAVRPSAGGGWARVMDGGTGNPPPPRP